jgi:pimeloyl-ACP methyl ester carboxylesterase
MPSFQHNGATVYYEEHGKGFPILTFAPQGLLSTVDIWNDPSAPINPVTEWSSEYRVITMDQRNAPLGRSRAPITAADGWHSYTADHIAVLDHLGIDKCHLYGQCIGGPFIMGFIKAAPQRVACAVAAQPSGRVGELKPGWNPRFTAWAAEVQKTHPEATREALDGFYKNMYTDGFLYSVNREFLKTCTTPVMVLAGNDEAHPFPISEEMSRLLPNCEFIREWKTGDALQAARPRVREFLKKHTPAA